MQANTVFLNGNYIPLYKAHISPLDRGFLFGDGVYEVIKSYNGNVLFLNEHIKRLNNSLQGLDLKFNSDPLNDWNANILNPFYNRKISQKKEYKGNKSPNSSIKNFTFFKKIIELLIQKNNLDKGEALIYLQITRGVYRQRTHEFVDSDISPTVFIMASKCQDNSVYNKGIRLSTYKDNRWYWCSLKTVNLLGNLLAKQYAVGEESHEALLVRDGVVLECSSSSLAIIKDGTIYSHPPADYILDSITMTVLRHIADKENIPFIDKKFGVQELKTADEVLVLSTVRDINHVIQLDNEPIGNKDQALVDKLKKSFATIKQIYKDHL